MPYKGNPHPKKEKHRPLQDEIAGDALAQGKGRTKKRERQPEDEFMTDAMSNKVLLQARKQLEEVEDEEAGICRECRRPGEVQERVGYIFTRLAAT